jgi:OOP family OmpA-OmpF porin
MLTAATLIAVLAGCATSANRGALQTQPAVPAATEMLTLNQLIVVADVTGSMHGSKFRHERNLLDAFTGAMPDGSYEAGINSFSGVSAQDWVQCPLKPYSRPDFVACEQRIEFLGSLTPLNRAIYMVSPQMQGKGGNGALLVFSDGLVHNESEVLAACEAMQAAHQGNLCIYTVQIGDSEHGRQVLEAMSASTDCGQSWSGESLNSAASIDQMVRTIFFGARPVAAVVPAPAAERREMVLLGDVLFDFDRDVLKPEGRVEVDKVIAILKEQPDRDIVIAGHTCDLGSDAYNMDLSQRRANTVRNYAVSQGIVAERVTTRAYGESTPAVPNTSEANRKLNRRITFVQ